MEVTLEITNHCPNTCRYCSTNASPQGGLYLIVKEISEFLHTINMESKVTRINISGGEPLSHPDFYQILCLCKRYSSEVWVYTNALTNIIYNSDIVDEIEVEANVCIVPGKSVYIPEKVDRVHLLQLVKQGRAKDMRPANLHASGNISKSEHNCETCDHVLLQADKKVVMAPCKKDYS
jgi:molybdenum cofactor biosynthesis enzyme MoaA